MNGRGSVMTFFVFLSGKRKKERKKEGKGRKRGGG